MPDAPPAPTGPEHLRLAKAPCLHCDCCTAELCAHGRMSALGCAAHARGGDLAAIGRCPCSSEQAEGSAAWMAAQVRDATRGRHEAEQALGLARSIAARLEQENAHLRDGVARAAALFQGGHGAAGIKALTALVDEAAEEPSATSAARGAGDAR